MQFRYEAEDSSFRRVSQRVEAQLGGLSKAGLNFTNLLKFGAGTFALGQVSQGLGAIVGSLSSALQEQEDAVIGLQAALNATGKSGAANFKILADEASRLQRVTRAGDDAILKASESLATLVPSLDVQGLKNAQTALVALSETFFDGKIDVAALQLGKTLGSTTNALSRYGIQIENSAAPASEKLAAILGDAKLQAAFAGATAKAQTYGGSLVQLGNAQGDLRESLGGIVAESLNATSVQQRLTERVLRITASLEENRNAWIGWGRVIASAGVVVYSAIETTTVVAFNLVQVLGRLGFALGSLARRDFQGVRDAARGIRGDFGDIGEQLEKDNRRWVQLANNIGLASEGLVTTSTAAERAAAGISSVVGASNQLGETSGLESLDAALARVTERWKVYGREVDVVAEREKVLRAEIDRRLSEGATAASVQPLVERLRLVSRQWELSADGAAAFAEQLRVTGAAGVEVANQVEFLAVKTYAVAEAGITASEALRSGLLGAAGDFGRAFSVTLDGIEVRVGDFIDSVLSRLATAFAASGFIKLLGLAFGGPLGAASFGSIFLGQLGVGQDVRGIGTAARAPAAAGAGGITFDLRLPPARSSREAMRDGEWQRELVDTLNQAIANGHRVRVLRR